ncbi:MAG: hypothetical protein K2O57_07305, partial [Acetatifactor sp.]|nr:hypothetical protein [Acetatifactor sp.]
EHEGRANMKIGNYFRSDYIAIQVLKSILCATIAFGLIFALFIFYDFEVFMQDIYQMDLVSFAKKILMYYGITVAVYSARYLCHLCASLCEDAQESEAVLSESEEAEFSV